MAEGDWHLTRKGANLKTRAALLEAIRRFFNLRGYLEVETPIRIPGPAPEYHIDAVPSGDWFLQTSPELCMKRLLAAGYDRIFQIARCFREGERGGLHLPEFTILEWYEAGGDYTSMMKTCEDLILFIADALSLGRTISYRDLAIDITPPWPRITVREAFASHAPVSLEEALAASSFDEILTAHVEPHLGLDRPVFLTDYPAEMASLAKLHPRDPTVAQRCELYLAGMEMANAFTELTDEEEQRRRFAREEARRRRAGKKPYPSPEAFLACLPSMPEAGGIALGVDRLVMIVTGAARIDDVVAFTPERL